MAGAIPADAVMQDRPVGRGYVSLQETAEHPWPVLSEEHAGEPVSVHEFHYSRLENVAPELRYAYRVLRGVGIDGRADGLIYKNTLATYSHQRNVGSNDWVARFVQHVRNDCRLQVESRKAS
jgi:cobyrinic acid a,c-diamide synthase